uniref:Transmembrane protein n=1 Tax=Medicago truncatula TaxID=3880 RepID=I3SIC4_MEDTR|nr:unknown [Medicago truncatula]
MKISCHFIHFKRSMNIASFTFFILYLLHKTLSLTLINQIYICQCPSLSSYMPHELLQQLLQQWSSDSSAPKTKNHNIFHHVQALPPCFCKGLSIFGAPIPSFLASITLPLASILCFIILCSIS